MKINPVAQGTGVPANPTVTPSSSDKIIRAKAIARGEDPPQANLGAASIEGEGQRQLPTIKMKTNVSPDRMIESPVDPNNAAVETQESPKSNISEPNGQEPAETRQLDPQKIVLAKARRALQVKERELAQREEALKASESRTTQEKDLISRLKTNPLSVLTENGVTYDQLTQAILENPSQANEGLNQLRDEIKSLKEELNSQLAKRDEQAESQVLRQLKSETDGLTAHGDEYEAIRQAKAQDKVVNLIHRTWQETGEILDVPTAAKLVNDQLIEDVIPFMKIKKVQEKLAPVEQQKTFAQSVQEKKEGPTKMMRTLTNRDAGNGQLDRRSRAIAAFLGDFKRG